MTLGSKHVAAKLYQFDRRAAKITPNSIIHVSATIELPKTPKNIWLWGDKGALVLAEWYNTVLAIKPKALGFCAIFVLIIEINSF